METVEETLAARKESVQWVINKGLKLETVNKKLEYIEDVMDNRMDYDYYDLLTMVYYTVGPENIEIVQKSVKRTGWSGDWTTTTPFLKYKPSETLITKSFSCVEGGEYYSVRFVPEII